MSDTLNPVADRLSHEGYRVTIAALSHQIRAVFRGQTIAQSNHVLVMRETRLPPVYYFPREDVDMAQLVASDRVTHCPFKGDASYWSLQVGDQRAENAVWSYEDPYDESAIVKGYMAFDWNAIDDWYEDDKPINSRVTDAAPAPPNPLIKWLIDEAWRAKSVPESVTLLAKALADAGFPIWRVRLLIQTLNPQLFATSYTWQRGSAQITEFQATHAGLQTAEYRNSPFAAIIKGEGGIRRQLEGANPRLDFPILSDLVAEGATDYVAVPLRFSDGQINILVLISDEPGGFATEQLGQLYEILANFGCLLEAQAQRISSSTLLQTYLGTNAGHRVMNGLVKRGDGEELQAVIWFSDLRNSTVMADTMARKEYLEALNQYFDAVAGAVIAENGEVLKFIGDAVLAIFAIDTSPDAAVNACQNALQAIQLASEQIARINEARALQDQSPLAFGTGLHLGNLTYGNVGTARRLDFTVIGPAVNETARIEALCKTLARSVIISRAFADHVPGQLKSIGHHELRGVRKSQELFTIG